MASEGVGSLPVAAERSHSSCLLPVLDLHGVYLRHFVNICRMRRWVVPLVLLGTVFPLLFPMFLLGRDSHTHTPCFGSEASEYPDLPKESSDVSLHLPGSQSRPRWTGNSGDYKAPEGNFRACSTLQWLTSFLMKSCGSTKCMRPPKWAECGESQIRRAQVVGSDPSAWPEAGNRQRPCHREGG